MQVQSSSNLTQSTNVYFSGAQQSHSKPALVLEIKVQFLFFHGLLDKSKQFMGRKNKFIQNVMHFYHLLRF